MPKFKDIPQFISSGNYSTDIPWDYLEDWLNKDRIGKKIDLNPDFQRGHVWSKKKQIDYIEYILSGGICSNNIMWNCPGWMIDYKGPFQLVDGKQRLESVRKFLRNELKAFGYYYSEYEDKLKITHYYFKMHVNNLPTRENVLKWYLQLNSGGVVHSIIEIRKVERLLEYERNKQQSENS